MSMIRASDAERDAVVERLHACEIEGRLTMEELEDRAMRALQARTHEELDTLTADLPPSPTPPAPQPSKVEADLETESFNSAAYIGAMVGSLWERSPALVIATVLLALIPAAFLLDPIGMVAIVRNMSLLIFG